MRELSGRTAEFTESVIRRMTRVADEFDAINLSQGFPEFDPPKEITEALSAAAKNGPHQYAITFGAKNFRDAIAKKHEHFSGVKVDPETEIVVTCGSTEAMMAAMMSVTNPGDKVIIFSPFYENYGADTILSGAEPIYVPLIPPTFQFEQAVLEEAFMEYPKAIVICNPSNPCGKVFTKEELGYIAALATKYDTYVIMDEVYEHILFSPYKHTYMQAIEGMRDRTIVCNSLSKTYSITGWRLGYVIAQADIVERIKKVHDFLTVGAASPLMEAAVVGLSFDDAYYSQLAEHYTHMKEVFVGGLKEIGLRFTEPQGTYFVLVDVSEFGVKDDTAFCEWMAEHVGVAGVPGSSFFKEDIHHIVRFHFAKQDDTLREAIRRLSMLKEKVNAATNVTWK